MNPGSSLDADSTKRRQRWEERYRTKRGADFCWYLDAPPTELVDLVGRDSVEAKAALDVGCGPGVVTAYLAGRFSQAVGMDIAHAAVLQARERASAEGVDPEFVVAAAPILPFRSATFSLVFDRGCIQALPREAWPEYFREVERLLAPGGVFQLYASKPLRSFPPLLSYRGLRARARWLLGRRGPQFLNHAFVTSLLPSSMRAERLEDFPFRPTSGPPRAVTHGIFRKAASGP